MKRITPLPKLKLFAGQVLRRLGKENALDISDERLEQMIAAEQVRRTVERRKSQIETAVKRAGKKEKGLEVSIVQGEAEDE